MVSRDMRSVLVVLIATFNSSSMAIGNTTNTLNTDDQQAEVVLSGLEVYEGAVESFEWSQTAYLPPCTSWRREKWQVLEQSTRFTSAEGQWYVKNSMLSVDPPDFVPSYDTGAYMGNRSYQLTYNEAMSRGMITHNQGFQITGVHAWRAMGYGIDFQNWRNPRPPSAVLRSAKQLKYLSPTYECPWPGVRGDNLCDSIWASVELRVDPQHGFAPKIITVIRPNDGLEVETTVVIKYQISNGVWVPQIGIHGSRYAQFVTDIESPLLDDRKSDFSAAETMSGIPVEYQSDDLRMWIRRMHRVGILNRDKLIASGPLQCFDLNTPTATPQIFVVHSAEINSGRTVVDYAQQMPPMSYIFDDAFDRRLSRDAAITRFREIVSPIDHNAIDSRGARP